MLVLSRYENEAVVIDRNIKVRVIGVKGRRVRLAIDAPREVPVVREELSREAQEEIPAPLSFRRAAAEPARVGVAP